MPHSKDESGTVFPNDPLPKDLEGTDGESGTDSVDYPATVDGIQIALNNQSDDSAQGDHVVSVENVIGTDQEEHIKGHSGTNILDGEADGFTLAPMQTEDLEGDDTGHVDALQIDETDNKTTRIRLDVAKMNPSNIDYVSDGDEGLKGDAGDPE